MNDAPVQSFAQSNVKLVEAFERWMLVKNYSESTRSRYSKCVRAFWEFIRSEDIRGVDLRTIRVFLAEKGRTPSVYQGYRVALRAFYRFLVLAHVIGHSPAGTIGTAKNLRRPLPRCLTEKEAEKLIYAALSLRDRAILELLYASGLRAQEICNLDVEDLKLAGGTLRVRCGKGLKDRVGMIGRKAVQALRFYLADRASGPVFLSRDGSRMSPQTVCQLVHSAARRAGLSGVHSHTLRHTFATVLLNRSADIRYIQELLGHKRVSTTAIYLHTAVSDLARVIERCHPHSEGENDDAKR